MTMVTTRLTVGASNETLRNTNINFATTFPPCHYLFESKRTNSCATHDNVVVPSTVIHNDSVRNVIRHPTSAV